MKLLNILMLFGLLATTGCNTTNLANSIDGTIARAAGNKPPAFFSVANVETMRDYLFETHDFSFNFPTAKESDFLNMGGWSGMSMRDGKTIAFGFKNSIVYHISVSTSGNIREYGKREKDIMNGEIASLRTHIKKRVDKQGKIFNATLKIIRGGKENYPCLVKESIDKKHNKRKISYGCFKINPLGTMVKGAGISLTYNKPKDPKLAKQYTYEDLKRRAKRTLDSLYIKDGWK